MRGVEGRWLGKTKMHFICRAQNETHSEMVEKMRFELTTPTLRT